MKPKKHMTIFKRMFFTILVPLIFMLTVFLYIMSRLAYQDALESAKSSVVDFAQNTSSTVRSTYLNKTDALAFTAHVIGDLDPAAPETKEYAANLLKTFLVTNENLYYTWFIFEPGIYGSEYYTKDYIRDDNRVREFFDFDVSTLADANVSDWYHEPLQSGEVYFDSVDYYDYGNGKTYNATISAPIHYQHEEVVIGVLGMDMLYQDLFSFLIPMQVPGERSVMLLSQDGTVIYSSDQNNTGKSVEELVDDPGQTILAALNRQELFQQELYSKSFKCKSFIYICSVQLDNASEPVYLYVDMPTRPLYAKARFVTQLIVALGCVTILIATFGAFTLSKILSEPIKKMTDSANKIADGDLDIKFQDNTHYDEELMILQTALRKMVMQLKLSRQHQDDFAEQLENQVAERTRQLQLMTQNAEDARQLAEDASQVKTMFLANMSHEIRTPMNAILGMSEILLDEAMPDEQKGYVSDIHVSAKSLLTIINDILDLSKLETGKLELSPASYDFPMMIEHINSMFKFITMQKSLAYVYSASDDLPQYLYGDNIRLRQVLINILNNAVKYTQVGQIGFHITTTEDMLQFDISDTGIGIKSEDQPLLFDPFRQFNIRKNRYIKGTGLGLSISRNLVEMMNGTIEVNSVPDKGSTFTVRIPRIEGDASQVVLETKACVITAPTAKVLVVDDNPVNLAVAKGFLKTFKINPDMVESGAEAIPMIIQNTYDLVFMDHMMPGMDGIETTRALRSMGKAQQDLVIIALSANAVSGAREMFLEAGMNDFLSKPINKAHLSQILENWLPVEKVIREEEQPLAEYPQTTTGSHASLLLKAAAESPDIDLEQALYRMDQQEDTYETVLKTFLKSTPGVICQMNTYLKQDNWQDFGTAIHGTKSALATLGAFALSDMALSLETAAKAGKIKDCLQGYQVFLPKLNHLIDSLTQDDEIDSVIEKHAGDTATLAAQLDSIAQNLQQLDFDAAADTLTKLKIFDFGESVNTAFDQLSDCIELFDCDQALEIIKLLEN